MATARFIGLKKVVESGVMCKKFIRDEKFSGLVDLDGYAFGDYLDGIGRIKASWYVGTLQ